MRSVPDSQKFSLMVLLKPLGDDRGETYSVMCHRGATLKTKPKFIYIKKIPATIAEILKEEGEEEKSIEISTDISDIRSRNHISTMSK